MEPRRISRSDIRVGDTVEGRIILTVGKIENDVTLITDTAAGRTVLAGAYTWTLLDRPEPPREPGSMWRDPVSGGGYVRTDETASNRAHYVAYAKRNAVEIFLVPDHSGDRPIIARLVSLDGAP